MAELTDEDVAALMAHARMTRQKAKAAADAEYDATVEAINRVKKLLAKRSEEIPEIPALAMPMLEPEVGRTPWPGLRTAIREAIGLTPASFKLDDIMGHLANKYPDNAAKRVTVSGELWRMNQQNEIEIIEKGSGKKQHIYRKVTVG